MYLHHQKSKRELKVDSGEVARSLQSPHVGWATQQELFVTVRVAERHRFSVSHRRDEMR